MKRSRIGLVVAGVATTLVSLAAPSYADGAALVSPHAASFSGPYSPKKGASNASDTCYSASTAGAVNTCSFSFPTPPSACLADPNYTFIGRLTVGVYSVGVPLMKMGGGVFEGHGVVLDGGVPTVYDVHVEVEGLCDEDTLAILPLNLNRELAAQTYRFTGYANA